MPDVIVFGGTGWVGHNIVKQFAQYDYDITIVSRGKKATFQKYLPSEITQVVADKSDADDMKRIFNRHYDIVIDTVPTETSIEHIANCAKGIKHYLHCSSTGGYAPLSLIPGDETMPYNGYGGGWARKAVYDTKVMNLFYQKGFPATVIRPSYITGPGMLPLDNRGGRRDDFISDILAGRTLELPNDGLALLQPVHVVDLARSFLLAARRTQSIGQIYNICLDKAVTLTRYLQITANALGKKITIELMPVEAILKKYEGQIHELGLRFLAEHMCYDIRKARQQLDYHPGITTEMAIEQTARWAAEQ